MSEHLPNQLHPAVLSRCAEEPIHRPGQVQPYGGLLVCDAKQVVSHASDNVMRWLGRDASACIGLEVGELFAHAAGPALRSTFAAAKAGESQCLLDVRPADAGGPRLDLTVSRQPDRGFVEIEAVGLGDVFAASTTDDGVLARFFADLQHSARKLANAAGSVALCAALCREARRIFGYHRVLVYRFDQHWNGTVVAEDTCEVYPPYLGHKFPESDIPRQARALFLHNPLRMIPDAMAIMRPLVGDGGDRLDMTRLLARAPAPVHLEYMRNMQTRASLTLSLRLDGKLWGLVACHHANPRYLSTRTRNAAELLVGHASALLQQNLRQDGEAMRTRLYAVQARLVEQMGLASNVLSGLCGQHDADAIGAVRAVADAPHPAESCAATDGGDAHGVALSVNAINDSGGGCAIHLDGAWRFLGDAPPPEICARVVDWLVTREPQDVIVEENLATHVPQVADDQARACGLLAISLPQSKNSYVLWFRPEWVRETSWAGNPHKHVTVEVEPHTGAAKLHPRTSFDRYKEVMRGHSVPVSAEEVEVVSSLRKNIIELDLSRKVAAEQRLRQQAEDERVRAEQAVALRERVLSIVSHDLRNPLNAIELTTGLARRRLKREAKAPSLEGHVKLLDNVERASRRMRGLVEDILTLSKIESGQVPLECAPVDARALLTEVQQLLGPVAENQQLHLEVHPGAQAVTCNADAERLMQVLSNLVSNAIKFSPEGGTITLDVAPAPHEDAALFRVRDDGPGIAKKDRERIFETFWQAGGENAKKGLGLGLSIVKHIVEAHGGGVWVENEARQGSTFAFTCPQLQTGARKGVGSQPHS